MSHGPGKLQREILAAVAQYSEPVIANRVCWDVAEARGALTGAGLHRRVARPFYTSFRAAVLRSRKAGLNLEERRIASGDELVDHYPYQTPFVWLRDIRRELLPVVRDYLKRTAPMFGEAANERYLVESMSKPERLSLRRDWLGLERTAVVLFAGADEHGHERLLRLITKGRDLFDHNSGISNWSPSLRECLDDVRRAFPDAVEVNTAGEAFYARVFPSADRRRTEFKSRLYSCVEFGAKVKNTRLQDELKHVLAVERPKVVTRIGGAPRRALWIQVPHAYALENKGNLDVLITRDVLRPLLFVSRD